ncbi:MAG: hypothetical protein HN348_27475 [Proteobacteria bacterium]|jgi:uncharacterized RDD family membrane protein YckC|nr:hypothetical protein [Pseudomonadota bacterium]
MKLASRSLRWFAYGLDAFLVVVALLMGGGLPAALALLFGLVSGDFAWAEGATSICFALVGVLFMALLFFQWWLIAVTGQTIGKRLVGIKIVWRRSPEARLGFLRGVILRNWVSTLLFCCVYLRVIDFIFILGRQRRCLHDFIANTKVIDLVGNDP